MSTPLTIPPLDELRADIRARAAELRALRRLLRLAEAAESARRLQEAVGQSITTTSAKGAAAAEEVGRGC